MTKKVPSFNEHTAKKYARYISQHGVKGRKEQNIQILPNLCFFSFKGSQKYLYVEEQSQVMFPLTTVKESI